MERKIELVINYYLCRGKKALDNRLKRIQDKSVSSERMLRIFGRTREAIALFLIAERHIAPEINRCRQISELEEIAFKAFSSIKGIGESTIEGWVLKQAYMLNINPEANCSDIIYKSARVSIKSAKLTYEQLFQYVRQQRKEFASFRDLDVVQFLNYLQSKRVLELMLSDAGFKP